MTTTGCGSAVVPGHPGPGRAWYRMRMTLSRLPAAAGPGFLAALSISVSLVPPIEVGIQPMIAAKPATQNRITAMPAIHASGWGD